MSELLLNILELSSPVILAGLGWLAVRIERYIKAKTDNQYLEGVLVRLNEAVWAEVKETQRNVVDAIKEANKDGKLTEAEKKKIKEAALQNIQSLLGPEGLALLYKVFGGERAATDFIGKKIEAAVKDMRDQEKKA